VIEDRSARTRLNQNPELSSLALALPVHDGTKMLRISSVRGPFIDTGGSMNWYDEITVSDDGPSTVNQGA
jgi:hypothetical protein